MPGKKPGAQSRIIVKYPREPVRDAQVDQKFLFQVLTVDPLRSASIKIPFDNRARRELPTENSSRDSLGSHGIRQSRCVADKKHPRHIEHVCPRATRNDIAMSLFVLR